MENGVMMQAFEWHLPGDGKYYDNMSERAHEIRESGFTAIWIPPVFKGMGPDDVGYGIYDMYDLGEFNQKGTVRTKYGTREGLERMIQSFRNEGIQVYADVVMNHKASADSKETFRAIEVDPKNRNKDIGEPREIEGWTGFDFPGRRGKYSDFKWDHTHFNGVDLDEKTGKKAIFRIIGENKGWNLGVSVERGNYDYLMFADIDHAHPEVKKEFMDWSEWFVKETGVQGFRLDAVKHIDAVFLKEFVENIKSKTGDGFYLLGEYWVDGIDLIQEFLEQTSYNIDLFDVPLHFNLHTASIKGEEYDLRKLFDNTLVKHNPLKAVTFVDNHDSQPGQSLESWVEPWFKEIAYGLILLRSGGYPCVFHGDYYGTGGGNPYEGIKDRIDRLIYLRKKHCFGEEHDYFQDKNLIGWVRVGTDENPQKTAVVVSNKDGGSVRMQVGKEYSGKSFTDAMENTDGLVKVDQDGFGDFFTASAGISVWVCKG